MKTDKSFLYVSLLFLVAVLLFFAGFIYQENSAGAGGYYGDFKNTWNNLNTFINYNIIEALSLTGSGEIDYYKSSRTPLLYIINALFNPYIYTKSEFILSIFIFSFSIPILFFFNLKNNLQNQDIKNILLITSFILLSPYFRTSAYWAGEENYGLLTSIISLILLNNIFQFQDSQFKKRLNYTGLIFFSSLCVYFDQKLLIIPLIVFFSVIFYEKDKIYKYLSLFLFCLLSLPYIYLITIWGGILPSIDSERTHSFHPEHIGYVSSILAFYIFPFIFFKKQKIIELIKSKLENNFNKYLLIGFMFYLIYLFYFNEYVAVNDGRGIAYKIANFLTNNFLLQELFTYFVFLISFFVLIIFFDRNFFTYTIVAYFFLISIFFQPIYHEYYDPIFLILIFGFLKKHDFINLKSLVVYYFYLIFILVSANYYYQSI